MLWIEPRPPGAPARVWRDWVLVAVLAATAVPEGLLRTDLPNAPAEIVPHRCPGRCRRPGGAPAGQRRRRHQRSARPGGRRLRPGPVKAFAGAGRDIPPRQPTDPLTEREEEVLLAVARGRTNTEIAAELFISISTVKTHIGSLLAKLGARNQVETAMWAYETGRVGRR